MPSYFPEGNLAKPFDNELRSLQKIVGLGGSGTGGGGGVGAVFSGHYAGGTPTQTPNPGTTAAIAYDLDSPFRTWNWDGVSAWF
jgi:hypothetical protein